jgi:hypothetical protein
MDAINCSPIKEFTSIPNKILRNPELSLKAKGLLSMLLSNDGNWHTYLSKLQTMTKDGIDGIRSGLTELENHGYFLRVRYRNAKTKVWAGSFWMYTNTPFVFEIQNQLETLKNKGFEPEPGFPHVEEPYVGLPHMENPTLKILINKNTNNKNTNINSISSKNGKITKSQFEEFWKIYPKKVNKGTAQHAWDKICNRPSTSKDRPTWREIKSAVVLQKKSGQWQDHKYIANPSTWLNRLKWKDDPKEMKSYSREDNNTPTSGSGYDPDYEFRDNDEER